MFSKKYPTITPEAKISRYLYTLFQYVKPRQECVRIQDSKIPPKHSCATLGILDSP